MQASRLQRGLALFGLFSIAVGCQTATQEERLAELAWRPAAAVGSLLSRTPDDTSETLETTADTTLAATADSAPEKDVAPLPIHHVSFWNQPETAPPPQRPRETIIPPEIPGADAPPITLPAIDPTQPPQEWRDDVADRYTVVPQLSDVRTPVENAPVWTLADLEAMASSNHPALRQAWAQVEIARGEALQAGLGPNPTVGYQGDTIGTAGTAGYNGVHVSQTFVTANKLGLAESVESFDIRSAEQAYRRERIQVLTNIRRHYADVLLAELESRLLHLMAELVAESYQTQIELVQIREAAPHEPLSLRAIATQLEARRLQADRDAEASWLQLAAAAGQPHLPRGTLIGKIDADLPVLEEATLLSQMLSRHTDLQIADIEISRSATDVVLQDNRIIPNVDVSAVVQHDDTTPINDVSFNMFLAMPIPVIDRNQGNLFAAEARLMQSRAQRDLTYQQLVGLLAQAHQQYLAQNEIASVYRSQILPDQVRVYRGIADRYRVAGEPTDFAEVVVAQQTLSGGIEDYLDSLDRQWEALIDIAELLQAENLGELGVRLDQ